MMVHQDVLQNVNQASRRRDSAKSYKVGATEYPRLTRFPCTPVISTVVLDQRIEP